MVGKCITGHSVLIVLSTCVAVPYNIRLRVCNFKKKIEKKWEHGILIVMDHWIPKKEYSWYSQEFPT